MHRPWFSVLFCLQELAVVLVFGFAMFAGGIMRLPQLMDKIPPLCYLHHVSFLRYVLEAFYVAEANQWAQEISLMYVIILPLCLEALPPSPHACTAAVVGVSLCYCFCVTACCLPGAPTTPSFCRVHMITRKTHTVSTLASRLLGACCSVLLYVSCAARFSYYWVFLSE